MPTTGADFPGASGDYIWAPDSAGLSVTGDITLIACLALDDWTPAGGATPISKWTATGNQRSWLFQVTASGNLEVTTSALGGTTLLAGNSAAQPTVSDGATLWIAVTLDVNDGGGNRVYKFYTSADPRTTAVGSVVWTQLGSTVTTAGTAAIFNSTARAELGAFNQGTASIVNGVYYYAEIRSGLAALDGSNHLAGGTTVGDPNILDDPANHTSTTFSDGTNTWTVAGNVDLLPANISGTAAGAATSSGTAVGTVTPGVTDHPGTAAGAATASGSAAATVEHPATAAGAATASGTATGSAFYIPTGWGSGWATARDNAGSQLVNIVAWGDSITQGYYSSQLHDKSYFGIAVEALQTDYGDGGSGFHSLRNTTGVGATGATYITASGTWTPFDLTVNETVFINSGAATLTFPGVRGTELVAYTNVNVFGTVLRFVVDGGSNDDRTIGAAAAGVHTESKTVSAGTHSVVLSDHSGGFCIPMGLSGLNADGIVGHNMGLAGRPSSAGQATGNLSSGNSGTVSITDFNPDLVIIQIGGNDIPASVSKATYKANLERLVALANGADVLFVFAHRGNLTDGSDLYTDYEEATYEVAAAETCAVYNAWVDGEKDWDAWDALDYWGTTNSDTGDPGTDVVHLSDLGHAHMGQMVYELLSSEFAAGEVTGTAVGAATSSGTATATIEHPASAAGATTGDGTSTATVEHPATATGAASGAGTSAATVEHPATAAGAATSSGEATGTVTPEEITATATGAAISSGTATGSVEHFGAASGTATSSGTATGSIEGEEPEPEPTVPERHGRTGKTRAQYEREWDVARRRRILEEDDEIIGVLTGV